MDSSSSVASPSDQPAPQRRRSPATPIAVLALVISLSGTAWAATTIKGSELSNRSVSHTKLIGHTITGAEINKKQLGEVPSAKLAHDSDKLGGLSAADYTENVWATETSSPFTLIGSTSDSDILKQSFVNDAPSKAGFLNFTEVQVSNPAKTGGAATVTLGLSIDGDKEPGSYTATIDPGETQSIFAVLKCNGMSPGHHTIGVTARSTETVDLGTRADDGLRPIVIPPGGHSSRFTGEG